MTMYRTRRAAPGPSRLTDCHAAEIAVQGAKR